MTALKREEEPDYVPIWELIINEPVINKLYGNVSYLDFADKIDLDGVTAPEDMRIVRYQDKPKFSVIDDFGIRWTYSGVVFQPSEGPIKRPEDIDSIELPDPDDKRRYYNLKTAVERFKGRKAIVFLSHDGFEHSWYLLGGITNLLRMYVVNAKAAKSLVERVWRYKEKVIRNAIELGADILLTGDDYAFRDRLMMSPTHFKEFVVPYLQKAVEIAKKNSMPFIKHTDGNLWEVMDTIIGTGIDGLHPLEPMADMDIGRVKERYGDKIAVLGNIDCSYVLPQGTEKEVSDAVKETIAKGSPGGGHILSSSNSIHHGVNPENYRTMVEVARKYGKYPIDRELIRGYQNKSYIKRLLAT
jgi:uroporphyrinogen decarboxylase